MAIQKLPVRFAMDRAGLVGADGATHAGSFDIAYLGCLPNIVLMAAADEAELAHMVATAAAHRRPARSPSAIRAARASASIVPAAARRWRSATAASCARARRSPSCPTARRLAECLQAADELQARGLSTTVADARFAKPLDEDLIRRLAREHEVLITVEEGSIGGFGTHVLHFLARDGLLDSGLKIRPLTLPDQFIDHDKPERQYELAGLDAGAILRTALAALGQSAAEAPARA